MCSTHDLYTFNKWPIRHYLNNEQKDLEKSGNNLQLDDELLLWYG